MLRFIGLQKVGHDSATELNKLTLLVGMQASTATIENSVEIP